MLVAFFVESSCEQKINIFLGQLDTKIDTMHTNLEDILLIDKPKGITSFDVIRSLKRHYPGQKIGHAGTLDPNASGLMIIGIGQGTNKLSNYVGLPKTYIAEILFGTQTDTGDIAGNVLEKSDDIHVSSADVQPLIESLPGSHILPVSKYSATKIGGTPAYKLARAGKAVPNLKREMEILSATFESFSDNTLLLELTVTSGTYVRSIAEEIGRKLSVHATLKNLRRTKVGDFSVDAARAL